MPKMNLFSFLSRRKMSQADLAKALATTPGNVNRWAKGDGVPGYDLCVKLLEMGMTTEELFGIAAKKEDISQDEFEHRVKEVLLKALAK